MSTYNNIALANMRRPPKDDGLTSDELHFAHALKRQTDKGEANIAKASRVVGIEPHQAARMMRNEFFRAYMFDYFDKQGTFDRTFQKLDSKLDAKIPYRFGKKTKMIADHATQMDAVREVLKIAGAYAPVEQHVTQTTTTTIDFSGEPIAVLHYIRVFGILPSDEHRRILTEGTPEARRALLASQTETIEGILIENGSPPDSSSGQ